MPRSKINFSQSKRIKDATIYLKRGARLHVWPKTLGSPTKECSSRSSAHHQLKLYSSLNSQCLAPVTRPSASCTKNHDVDHPRPGLDGQDKLELEPAGYRHHDGDVRPARCCKRPRRVGDPGYPGRALMLRLVRPSRRQAWASSSSAPGRRAESLSESRKAPGRAKRPGIPLQLDLPRR